MVKTTFVVAFGEGTSSEPGVVVELEPSLNRDKDGNEKTSFSPGDPVYFTVHYPSTLKITSVETTSGDATFSQRGDFERKQKGVFFVTADDPVSLQHVPSSPLEFFWFGKVGQLEITGRDVKALNAPCIGDVTYKMTADLYRYTPPPTMVMNEDNQYLSGVVITMESV